ncbi:Aminodeoxychorismate synthase (ADC synthase) (4-amino-4-deoxychorismate synthase) (p-aminobenzoate synthase) [Durusdinium trenchii]|uniref:aminodeoxychorismate synthase n=1 Tax=Durusdinium trenchii TaxID=1381693 RepID=A0ABP0R781_9DINO
MGASRGHRRGLVLVLSLGTAVLLLTVRRVAVLDGPGAVAPTPVAAVLAMDDEGVDNLDDRQEDHLGDEEAEQGGGGGGQGDGGGRNRDDVAGWSLAEQRRMTTLTAAEQAVLETPRGLHWEARWGKQAQRQGQDLQRLAGLPFKNPGVDDPGADYLAFDSSLVHARFRSEERLVYDLLVVRPSDKFGLIADTYSDQELRTLLQQVVDIFAVANVHVRIDLRDVQRRVSVSEKRAVAYLNYVEGQDANELKLRASGRDPDAKPLQPHQQRFAELSQHAFGEPVVDWDTDRPGLRQMVMQDLLDWILGFPVLATPWDMVYSTAVFPVYFFHNMNGIGGSGRVVVRAGSCWEKDKVLPETQGRRPSCRRFQSTAASRVKLEEPVLRRYEKLRMAGRIASRLWAHEIGHQLSLHHPKKGNKKCSLYPSWDKAQLMVQQRSVGIVGHSCSSLGHPDQGRATRLTVEEMQSVRAFVQRMDIRPSATLPSGITLGPTTMQLGATAPPVSRKLKKHVERMHKGRGGKLAVANCSLPQHTIAFTGLVPSTAGRVARLRWVPAASARGASRRSQQVEVLVLDPDGAALHGPAFPPLKVAGRSGALHIPSSVQHMHVELDLNEPLEIHPGQILALTSSQPLNIDQQRYASARALFADVVGERPFASGLVKKLLAAEDVPTMYPKVALAQPRLDSFAFRGEPGSVLPEAHTVAGLGFARSAAAACAPLLFNFDLLTTAACQSRGVRAVAAAVVVVVDHERHEPQPTSSEARRRSAEQGSEDEDNDDFGADWEKLCANIRPGRDFDAVVISPGPGTPEHDADVGLSKGAALDDRIPVLGVCLGHQLLALVSGCAIGRAPEPMHGRLSDVIHNQESTPDAMFAKIPSPFQAVRYHSLIVLEEGGLPDSVEVTARTPDGIIMGLKLRSKRVAWGVQFHPESISTAFGHQLVENFLQVCRSSSDACPRQQAGEGQSLPPLLTIPVAHQAAEAPIESLPKVVRVFQFTAFAEAERTDCSAEVVFETLFGKETAETPHNATAKTRFWLDSASRDVSTSGSASAVSRFSFMGDGQGPLSRFLEFFVEPENRSFQVADNAFGSDRGTPQPRYATRVYRPASPCKSQSTWERCNLVDEGLSERYDVFAALERLMAVRSEGATFQVHSTGGETARLADEACEQSLEAWDLPFPFAGGCVGFFGYGLRRLCGVKAAEDMELATASDGNDEMQDLEEEKEGAGQRQSKFSVHEQVCGADAYVPDASFLISDRVVVWDHDSSMCYLVVLCDSEVDSAQREWVSQAVSKLEAIASMQDRPKKKRLLSAAASLPPDSAPPLRPDASDEDYLRSIQRCVELIHAGETYEVCLTKQVFRETPAKERPLRNKALEVYQRLRASNPAPYAAFWEASSLPADALDARGCDVAVCCSSPERFLRVTAGGQVESKPIKGTAPRGKKLEDDRALARALASSEKDRAENLMIVDLVRNDLGRTCAVGSVTVPKLMKIESYANVHQMVSTVRGQLGNGDTQATLAARHRATMAAIRAAFPGGSMTGAPKLRTMEIIDQLEKHERGIYSGALGFVSLTGAADLNIVIRSAVLTPGGVSVGTGGAIVALSDPQEEVDETTLKAHKLQSTIAEFLPSL